jgi:hypothetical protein
VRHFNFVSAIDRPGGALFLVNAQHIAEIGRAVTENGEVLAYALLQQAEHQCFRQRALDELGQTHGQCLLKAVRLGDRTCARTHARKRV